MSNIATNRLRKSETYLIETALVLEDRGSVAHYLEESLLDKGHRVFSAFNVSDAQYYWESERIDCIIADSNMSPEGLNDLDMEKTMNGLLTGWIWLRKNVFGQQPEMRKRTIIYTDYFEQLREHIPLQEFEGIWLFPKKGLTSPAETMLQAIERIAWEVNGGSRA